MQIREAEWKGEGDLTDTGNGEDKDELGSRENRICPSFLCRILTETVFYSENEEGQFYFRDSK